MNEEYEDEVEFDDEIDIDDEEVFCDPWKQTFEDYCEEQNRKGTPGSMGY